MPHSRILGTPPSITTGCSSALFPSTVPAYRDYIGNCSSVTVIACELAVEYCLAVLHEQILNFRKWSFTAELGHKHNQDTASGQVWWFFPTTSVFHPFIFSISGSEILWVWFHAFVDTMAEILTSSNWIVLSCPWPTLIQAESDSTSFEAFITKVLELRNNLKAQVRSSGHPAPWGLRHQERATCEDNAIPSGYLSLRTPLHISGVVWL